MADEIHRAERRPTVMPVEARLLAERFAEHLTSLAQEMFEVIAAEIEEVRSDRETAALTLASCVSGIETALTMLRHGIPVERAEAPVAALEHARHMATRELSIDTTLRFYRLGHAFFWRKWIAALSEEVDDPARLAQVLEETAAFTFAYTDAVSVQVSAELLAERDRRQRRMTAIREDVVAEILAGADVDASGAERRLGFSLAGPLIAFRCWSEFSGRLSSRPVRS